MYPQANRGEKLIAAIGSMTAAIKAQRALASSGIGSEVISLSPSDTRRGCAYGLEFSASDEREARAVLRIARIGVSQYLRKDELKP